MYIEPILNYATTVWPPQTTCGINKLKSVQKRVACSIVKDYRRTSSITRILNSLSLKSISYIHTKMRLLTFYKIVYKLVELPLPDNIYYSFRSTRGNEHKFILPQTTVNSYKYNFFPRSINLWNRLTISNDYTLSNLVLYSDHFPMNK